MFKLIVALFLVSEGVPAEAPVHVMNYNHTAFETEETCREFLTTEDGRAVMTAITLTAMGQGIAARFACVQAEDNSF